MSDEIDCPPRYPGGRYCPQSRFQCNNNLCVSLTDICDGTDDCGDNSDEKPTMCGEFIAITLILFYATGVKRIMLLRLRSEFRV